MELLDVNAMQVTAGLVALIGWCIFVVMGICSILRRMMK
jgi:hypothetical protein